MLNANFFPQRVDLDSLGFLFGQLFFWERFHALKVITHWEVDKTMQKKLKLM